MDTGDIKKFLDNMVKKGKISQEDADKKLAGYTAKEEARAKYITDKAKLTKADLQGLLDILTK